MDVNDFGLTVSIGNSLDDYLHHKKSKSQYRRKSKK